MLNLLDTATELVHEVGELQLEYLGKKHDVQFKDIVINIVTEVDKKSEEIIVNRIQKDFPSHDILAEEGAGKRKNADYRWIVDPLDGTVNYNNGYPFFGPSIAVEYKGELVLGVVFLPKSNEIFIAEKASGSELNGQKISVSKESKLINTLLATGFAYQREEQLDKSLNYFRDFIHKSRAVRRDGMAEGDLCYLACGRFDGFWEEHLSPWDVAAGTLIIREAGGKVTNFDGSPVDIYGPEIVASNGLIHDDILKVLKGKL